MPRFREKTPRHRQDRRVCQNYTSYKKTLRADFDKRCGYCNAVDTTRIRNYTIDHFVPQNPDGWINTIAPNSYKNLIYSCSFCNGAKNNKWPTKNQKKYNDGNVGFIKPTTLSYGRLFKRDKEGFIIIKSTLRVAKYIHTELNLGLQIHSLNWKIEKFEMQEKKLTELQKKVNDPNILAAINDIKILRLAIFDHRNQIIND